LLGKITHLELFDTTGSERMENLVACFHLMPRLTHLALASISFGVPLQTALRDKNMQCILFLVSDSVVPQEPESPGVLAEDDQFVCMDQREHTGARTGYEARIRGESYWALADAFIAARRKGTVDRKHSVFSYQP
jgi:hypothetical protein